MENEYDASPLLVINGDKYDFMNNQADQRTVLQAIYDELFKIGSIKEPQYQDLSNQLVANDEEHASTTNH